MLTNEALRYCNNRIQELVTSYDNETIQKLRYIVECLFGYLNEHDINDVTANINTHFDNDLGFIFIEINNYNRHLFLDTNSEYVKEQDKLNSGAFDLHNVNKLFDWVFTDEVH